MSFRDGCDIIIEAITAKGQKPASNAPADIAKAITNINTTKSISVRAHAHSKGGLTYIYVYLTCNGTTKMLANNHDEDSNQETKTNLGSVVF